MMQEKRCHDERSEACADLRHLPAAILETFLAAQRRVSSVHAFSPVEPRALVRLDAGDHSGCLPVFSSFSTDVGI